jgi:putative transposase
LATEKEVNITAVCRQLGYSKQAFYKSSRLGKIRSCHRKEILRRVIALRGQMPRLGTRKLYYLLQDGLKREGIALGRDALFRILREEDLLVARKKRYAKTTDSRHWMRKYPDLAKTIELQRPEQLWVADITYLCVSKGFSYLHLITDAYSKMIMGYHLSENIAATSTIKALEEALKKRKYNDELVHHSDRGLQYCSSLYTRLLNQKGVHISMTEDGSPYDNAVAERVNGILKNEFGLDDVFSTHHEAIVQVKEAIEIYNKRRPHISNNLLTPEAMHEQRVLKPRKWSKKAKRTLKGPFGFLSSVQ